MKTFEQLKESTTEDIFNKIVKLAKDFYLDDAGDLCWLENIYIKLTYPLIFDTTWWFVLLHRAVEEWNNITGVGQSGCIFIQDDCVFINSEEPKTYLFNNYQPSHLTPCEMAIWDCLIGVLK